MFAEFRRSLPGLELSPLSRFDFYEAASASDVAVAIATGERRIYANLLLTIGVVAPDASPDPAASTNPSARPSEDR